MQRDEEGGGANGPSTCGDDGFPTYGDGSYRLGISTLKNTAAMRGRTMDEMAFITVDAATTQWRRRSAFHNAVNGSFEM